MNLNEKVLASLRNGEATASELADRLNEKPRHVRQALRLLRGDCKVDCQMRGERNVWRAREPGFTKR